MSKYFWISIFISIASSVFGQVEDVLVQEEKSPWIPTGVRFGTNAVRLVRTALDNGYNSWDVSGDIDFNRFLVEVGYGRESITNNRSLFEYKTSGNFFRIGLDGNMITYPKKGNAMVGGIKYVTASYSEKLAFDQVSNFGSVRQELENSNISLRWFEVNFGVKGKVFSNLHAGFYVRFKVFRKFQDETNFSSYRIPGFGLGDEDSRTGFDYYIMWRIPFRKTTEILPHQ